MLTNNYKQLTVDQMFQEYCRTHYFYIYS